MVREFPVGDQNAQENHPFISMTLFIACIAATIAIVSSLCGALSRKKTPSSSAARNHHEMKENKDSTVPSPNDHNHGSPPSASESENAVQNEEFLQQSLPPPPGMQRLSGADATSFQHHRSNSTAPSSSHRKLPSSMSMRALGNGLGKTSRQSSKRDQDNDSDQKKKDKKMKDEDFIWKKTIILGEKCKVPDEDDEDAILYDEKGNRISTYHRKSTSLALSRQSSNVDPNAIPSYDQGQRDEILLRNS